MASARGNSKDGLSQYEQDREARIAMNKQRLAALQIPSVQTVVAKGPSRKRTKRTHIRSDATSEGHNLRPRSQRNRAEIVEEQIGEDLDCESLGDFLGDNEDLDSGPQRKRKGRGITKLDDIFARSPNMPKIKIMLYEYGQPIGKNSKKFSSAIGCQVRKTISVACLDWRLVDAEKKYEVWEIMKHRTEVCKENRGKMKQNHTSGSKSFACSRHELDEKLGRPARRDELFIKTHTRKNGVSLRQAEPIINKLKDIVEAYPELKEKTIQEGDVFATVCGEKEPKGNVRCLGLGPTPQQVGTPGLKAYTPTRLQMEVLARKKLQSENAALQQRIAALEEAREEERMARHNAELISHNGSNSRPQSQSPCSEGHAEANHDAQSEDDGSDNNEHSDEDETLLANKRSAAPARSVQLPPQSQQCSPTSVAPTALARNDVARSPHAELVGKEVILYAVVRSDLPVAKGTVVSINPNTIVGGQVLGRQYCEVIVNLVLKRDAILPRPYAEMNNMADTHMMSIAWPYRKLKVSRASQSIQGTAGSSGRNARRVP